jgi:NitT/TauT family transport system ATP-binding protein
MSTSIEVRGVSKVFALPNNRRVEAVQDISLTVGENEFVSLVGPSGCGKSTLLRMVADIVKPSQGEIRVLGHTPTEARLKRLYSFMFQDPVMLPWRSVLQNVQLPLEVIPDGKSLRSRARDLLQLVGLSGFEDASPRQLSGGMKQRAALARALLLSPKVLLMDEPFGALDEITRDQMNLELLRIWRETTASVIFVTHSIEEAVFLSDRVCVFTPRPGKIREIIPIDLPRPRTLEMKQTEEMFRLTARARAALSDAVADAVA